jgi:RNA polymerase sigma-70 factor (ECF subfamily)
MESEAARAERHDLFRRIYGQEIHYVWNSLRRLGVLPEDIEDVAHEALLSVFKKLHEVDPERPIRPWLFGFLYRTSADYRKRAHRRYEVPDDGAENDAADEAPTAEQRLSEQEERALVLDALERLPLEKRALIVMIDIDGHAAPAAADALGIPLNTAYSRLRVAREEFTAAVRRLLARRGGR